MMSAMALRAGLRRGRIEFRQMITSPQDIWNFAGLPLMALVVMFLLRGNRVPGTDFSLGSQAIPGILGMHIAFAGIMGMAMTLVAEREDGTLLRAKATPNGMVGYLTGKVVTIAGTTTAGLLIVLVPAALLFDGLELGSPRSWLTLAWVLALGLVATLPLGAIIGSLGSSPQSVGFIGLPIMGLLAISGIFYPIGGFPGWLQGVAQVFPVYWLGLGMRSALLPGELAAAEIGGSWRHLETAAVLGVWAVLGLLLAPVVLRRMARRESGSAVAARRQKAAQRTM